MVFSSLIHTLQSSSLIKNLSQQLKVKNELRLQGINRLSKGLISSVISQTNYQNLLVICATSEEAGRWTKQLEIMGWKDINFYFVPDTSPYEELNIENEIIWTQMQVLSNLFRAKQSKDTNFAIVTTERSLQPHLPSPSIFYDYCLNFKVGVTVYSKDFAQTLSELGYKKVNLVEKEGEWSRRGDILDIFPVSSEIPIRLEWLGDELEKIREFDISTQRSLNEIEEALLTPINFNIIAKDIIQKNPFSSEQYVVEEKPKTLKNSSPKDQLPLSKSSSLFDYLPSDTLCAFDEIDQCKSHNHKWLEYVEKSWHETQNKEPKVHRSFEESFSSIEKMPKLYLSELSDVNETDSIDILSRSIPVNPHQFSKLAEILRGKREIFNEINISKYSIWLISAQPSRTVTLLQEHDYSAQFIPNIRDYPAIKKSHAQGMAVALKHSGLVGLEGFILPIFRIAVITDKEFFGQSTLGSSEFFKKRRRSNAKKVNLQKLNSGDHVVHKSHGIGKFLRLENLSNREYLVVQYSDGVLRVPADSLDNLLRYSCTDSTPPKLHKMTGKDWGKLKQKIRKNIKKLAFNLLHLYAERAQKKGYSYPADSLWQQELEDSFPYQATPDQVQAIREVKIDLESNRPMDRLICGDVGFGKTEVAIRAIFKVVTSGHKQVVFLAPTTILTQQHYNTLRTRFAPYPISIGLLNRFRTTSEKKDIIERLTTGELDIVVGTQQLLGKNIKFKDLGLLVIDEEQRFGVNHKEKIRTIKANVDVLTLTATPIPRTLHMSLSGIREMSLISTPPPSRRSIKTHLSSYDPNLVKAAVRAELDRGGQVFYVVPRIEHIDELVLQLKRMIPDAKILVAHGQMDVNNLELTMLNFNNGDADILVCTTIIESGLDIPKVNTIIIEDAQKFGLSQLYQLRGRVGRSGIQAHAWLFYPSKSELTDNALKRLNALQEFSELGSGYHLATRDLEIRGAGNLLGAEQSGQMEAIGFELYMDMLQEAIKEVQGEKIPEVEDTQIDLKLTAFIPNDYIADIEQKIIAYRTVAVASSKKELDLIVAEWSERYGSIPDPVKQLLKTIELKQLSKSLGFSHIKIEGKNSVVLKTPMEEPAWIILQNKLPEHLQTRFVYNSKKIIIRGLGSLSPQKQLESLLVWFKIMQENEKV